MNYILETLNLSKKSGNSYRVKELSMQVPVGSVYGFLGPNGAGKSTTLKMILGLIHPDSGEIKVFNQKLNSSNKLSILGQTGSLIENPGGYGHLTGLENMQIIQKLKGVKEDEIERSLKTVRLFEQRDKKLKNYSLGMKQRLGIAMALLGSPKLLILDEPTNGLDVITAKTVVDSLEELKEEGKTIVISSHIFSLIEKICDRAAIIIEGRLTACGSIEEIKGGKSLEDRFFDIYKEVVGSEE